MKPLKIKTNKHNLLWQQLQPIFLNDYKGCNNRVKRELKKIGIEVYGNAHPKIKIKNQVITLTSTSGRRQIGRVILREIRMILEQEE